MNFIGHVNNHNIHNALYYDNYHHYKNVPSGRLSVGDRLIYRRRAEALPLGLVCPKPAGKILLLLLLVKISILLTSLYFNEIFYL